MDPKIRHIEEDGLVYEVRTYPSGNKYWYYKGKRHRLNGPAVELVNGSKEYYINDKHHRLDGPAVEFVNGYKAYCINDECFKTFEEYKEAVIQIKIKEILNRNES